MFRTRSRIVLLLVGVARVAFGQELLDTNFEGSREVGVVVIADDKLVDSGFPDAQVKVDVELQLRRAGIEVADYLGIARSTFSRTEYDAETKRRIESLRRMVLLRIRLRGVEDDGLVIYHLIVSARQTVLVPMSGKHHQATTWEDEQMGRVGMKKIEILRSVVTDLVNRFLNEWMRQNPKRLTGSSDEVPAPSSIRIQ